jgi:hypothetical protein
VSRTRTQPGELTILPRFHLPSLKRKYTRDTWNSRLVHTGRALWNQGSNASKGFAYAAAKEYHTPLGIIAEYLDVGRTAVSAMCLEGKEIFERYKIDV